MHRHCGIGSPLWARALRSQPIEGMEDNLTPGDWSKRWQLRQLSTWLSRIDRHDRLRELGADRVEKEVLLKDAYERSIELRTWLELSRKATDGVKAALAAYADAVRRIGKGTGKRAGRYRREARAASDRAKGALRAGSCRTIESRNPSRLILGCSTLSSSTKRRNLP
jgi:hypothetical protein